MNYKVGDRVRIKVFDYYHSDTKKIISEIKGISKISHIDGAFYRLEKFDCGIWLENEFEPYEEELSSLSEKIYSRFEILDL